MKLPLDEIGDEGHFFEEILSSAWLGEALGAHDIFQPMADGSIRVKLTRRNERFEARGELIVSVAAPCSRCLTRVEEKFVLPLSVCFVSPGAEPIAEEDGQLQAKHLEWLTHNGSEIDLGQLVRDELSLQLPINPLCSKSCAGLCAECGQELNKAPCGCIDSVDPRWSKLETLKLN